MELIDKIKESKIIVIIRGFYGETLFKTVQALNNGGIDMVEVTFDQNLGAKATTETAAAIKMLVEKFPNMDIGAGTVLTKEQVIAAHAAGAKYIISPNVSEIVIKTTKELGLVSIPGAITPTEIVKANECGADLIKIFPANTIGLDYIKDVMAPLNHIDFLAAAGVNRNNINEFIDVGYQAFGISGDLLRTDLIKIEDFDGIEANAKDFLSKIKKI